MLNKEFAKYVDELPLLMERLRLSKPLTPNEINARRTPGVYCFSEDGHALYIGRTKDFSRRYCNHCAASSGENTAAFAFLLARKAMDREKPTYGKVGSRKDLMRDPAFVIAFQHAKQQIRNMEARFVEISDHNLQHLLNFMHRSNSNRSSINSRRRKPALIKRF